jgi:hypothetical protein
VVRGVDKSGVFVEWDFVRNREMQFNPKLYQKKKLFPTNNQSNKVNFDKMIIEMKNQSNYLISMRWM